MKRGIKIGKDIHCVSVINTPKGRHLVIEGAEPAHLAMQSSLGDDTYRFDINGHTTDAKVITKGENVFVEAFGRTFTMTVLDPVEQAHATSDASDPSAKAPMPGIVVEQHVAVGDKVDTDQALLTIESMKLLTIIRADGAGTVVAINYHAGDTFNKGVVLVQVQVQVQVKTQENDNA